MKAEVVTIGSEILAGLIPEGNFRLIAEHLASEGVAVTRHTVVPDEREALGSVLRAALGRSPLVITTGGLGATPDDVTRRVLASALGCKLIFRESLLAELQEKYRRRGRVPSPALEAMALVPAGAQPVPNPVGMAPGFLLHAESSLLCALPGVPAEMEAMLTATLLPLIKREGGGSLVVETLRTAGIPESVVYERVAPVVGEEVSVGYQPSAGRVDLRLSVTDGEKGRAALVATVRRLAEALGPALYGRGRVTLEETVLEMLQRVKRSLAVAESLTGGRIGAALTQVPGSSAVFRGGVAAYSDAAKQRLLGVSERTLARHGAVSAQTAREMASGARRALEAEIAISATGLAGPGGGSAEKPIGLVYFGYSDARATKAFGVRFGGNRELIQQQAVTVALNLLRLALIGRLDGLVPSASRQAAQDR
ncbi:MAG: CinA family nicotinamide mononucleotide deamidase-related protein [Candidatus Eisenbacteria bacterium]|nr:CinA family nicotinamide mononucleotide deamidase-related protein [Candidatus Eisenbacteria bacterium]